MTAGLMCRAVAGTEVCKDITNIASSAGINFEDLVTAADAALLPAPEIVGSEQDRTTVGAFND